MPRVYDEECPSCGQCTVEDGYCKQCRWVRLEDIPTTPEYPTPVTQPAKTYDHSDRVEKYWEPGLGPCRCDDCERLPMNYVPPTTGATDAPPRDSEPTPGVFHANAFDADDERGDAEPPDTDLWDDLGSGG